MQKTVIKIRTKKIMLGALRPRKLAGSWRASTSKPSTEGSIPRPRMLFKLNPPSQLVIGLNWLVFLNQVLKQSKTQSFKSPIHYECWIQNLNIAKI